MENKTHIWLITTDQMRADAIGFENKAVLTPVLDRLASEGTVFSRAYCASPICTPARASIFTGRYPHTHGAWNVGVSLSEDEATLCDHLKQWDYRTVGIGKMHFRPQCKSGFSKEPEAAIIRDRGRTADGSYYGFEEQHITEDNAIGEYMDELRFRDPTVAERLERDQYRSDDTVKDVWESDMPVRYHQSHWIADKSIETILNHNRECPLFLWTSFVDPHHPFNPPRDYAEMYADLEVGRPIAGLDDLQLRPLHLLRQGKQGYWPGGGEPHDLDEAQLSRLTRCYYAMITFIDKQIGRIIEAWRQRGMYDNVLIVFTSDHGELLGDHGLMYKGPWFYEGVTRIPMIFRGPGVCKGRKSDALMEHVDIVPTLLDMIGKERPYGIQGISQQEVILGLREQVRESAMTSYDAHDRGIHAKCLRTDRYKLVVFANETYGELFDLNLDPGENRNLFYEPSLTDVKLQLMEMFVHRMMQDQDPLPERKAHW